MKKIGALALLAAMGAHAWSMSGYAKDGSFADDISMGRFVYSNVTYGIAISSVWNTVDGDLVANLVANRGAKSVCRIIIRRGESPEQIAKSKDWMTDLKLAFLAGKKIVYAAAPVETVVGSNWNDAPTVYQFEVNPNGPFEYAYK